jgi:hypothetical protein
LHHHRPPDVDHSEAQQEQDRGRKGQLNDRGASAAIALRAEGTTLNQYDRMCSCSHDFIPQRAVVRSFVAPAQGGIRAAAWRILSDEQLAGNFERCN